MPKPLCFIIMPFGKKKDIDGNRDIDFNKIYNTLIKPAIEDAGMEPIRADEEQAGGIIHKPMYERLILCDYAVADLTTANANVFYELGVRHVVKPTTTVTIFANNTRMPFDVNFLRCIPYGLDEHSELTDVDQAKKAITNFLLTAKKNKTTDSPIYDLLKDGFTFTSMLDPESTGVLQQQVEALKVIKKQLAQIKDSKETKEEKAKKIDAIVESIGDLDSADMGTAINIMLGYRSIEAYSAMVAFIEKMPKVISKTVMVQEQYGLALNRIKRRQDAIDVLQGVVNEHGASSETLGILGRVYKDMYDEEKAKNPDSFQAKANIKKAIDTYLKGFEVDSRDYYPGVNAVSLMEICNDPRIKELTPIVSYAALQKIKCKIPNYWDYATLVELAVIGNDKDKAFEYLETTVTFPRVEFERNTTIVNLQRILDKRQKENPAENYNWIEEVIAALKA